MSDRDPTPRIAGILLAAGHSGRYGGDKRVAELPGGPALAVAAARTLRAALPWTVAVVRPDDGPLSALLADQGLEPCPCPAAGLGMGHSLACGVAATRGADGWLIALADMPWVRPQTLHRLITALAGGAPLAAPYHRGRRGHPVAFSRGFRDALLGLQGDRGARGLVEDAAGDLVRVECDDPGVLSDIDTPTDLETTP
jgi:molybdenum cofactor cytidylyltransferase